MSINKFVRLFVLVMLLTACNEVDTPNVGLSAPTSQQTAEWEAGLEGIIAGISHTIPPQRPERYDCSINVPEAVTAAYNERYLTWVVEQVTTGASDELAANGILVNAGNPQAQLIISPLYGCKSGSHSNDGSVVSILNNNGAIWSLPKRVGIPFIEFADQQIVWDGAKWILLANQQFTYRGMSEGRFLVWHIAPDEDSWRAKSYEFPKDPTFSWGNGEPPAIEMYGHTHRISGNLAYIEPPCEFSNEFHIENYRKQASSTYSFGDNRYQAVGTPVYSFWDIAGNPVLDWEKYCLGNEP